jgi:hypothetical protein
MSSFLEFILRRLVCVDLSSGGRKKGIMEYWNNGVVGKWNISIMEWWVKLRCLTHYSIIPTFQWFSFHKLLTGPAYLGERGGSWGVCPTEARKLEKVSIWLTWTSAFLRSSKIFERIYIVPCSRLPENPLMDVAEKRLGAEYPWFIKIRGILWGSNEAGGDGTIHRKEYLIGRIVADRLLFRFEGIGFYRDPFLLALPLDFSIFSSKERVGDSW